MGRADVFPEGTVSAQRFIYAEHGQANAQFIRYMKRLGGAMAILAVLCVGNTAVLSWHIFQSGTTRNKPEAADIKIEKELNSARLELDNMRSKHPGQGISENDSKSAVMMVEKNVTAMKAVIDSFRLKLDTLKSQQAEQDSTRHKSEAAVMELEKELNSVRHEFEDMRSKHSEQENDTESAVMMVEKNVTAMKVAIDIFRLEFDTVKSQQAEQGSSRHKSEAAVMKIEKELNSVHLELEDIRSKYSEQENDSESAAMMVEKNVIAIKAVIDSFRLELDTVKYKQAEQDETNMQLLTCFDDLLARVNMTDCKVARLSLLEEVHECNQSGREYLVSGVYAVPDKHLTASSSYNAYHGPERSRLNTDATSTGMGAWSSGKLDVNQWIQVELNNASTVTTVTTQGRKGGNAQWVLSYKLQYSIDGKDWMTCCGKDQVFTGNTDRNTLVTNALQQPIRARYVRLVPQTWHGYISMRFDLTGCPY